MILRLAVINAAIRHMGSRLQLSAIVSQQRFRRNFGGFGNPGVCRHPHSEPAAGLGTGVNVARAQLLLRCERGDSWVSDVAWQAHRFRCYDNGLTVGECQGRQGA